MPILGMLTARCLVQGTNAHVVLEAGTVHAADAALLDACRGGCWKRLRHWFAPPIHPWLRSATAAASLVRFQGPGSMLLGAFLGDSRAGDGRVFLPSGLGLEVGHHPTLLPATMLMHSPSAGTDMFAPGSKSPCAECSIAAYKIYDPLSLAAGGLCCCARTQQYHQAAWSYAC